MSPLLSYTHIHTRAILFIGQAGRQTVARYRHFCFPARFFRHLHINRIFAGENSCKYMHQFASADVVGFFYVFLTSGINKIIADRR